uniref:DDE Tnp4 domain-containing protein n=1 Tax=Brassica oleracea var. oleracea TaxID=109376 RepID=A0A0D3A5Z9_BRAOL
MRGRSFAMTRSGVIYLHKEPQKKRKGEDGAQSSTSRATEGVAGETVDRPPGVKAAKRSAKKPMEEGKGREEFERVWSYKQEDLSRREKLSKIGLFVRLLARTEPLPDYEETLKKKLINELFSTPQVTYFVNGREYHLAYYLTDGIYPKWATFIQSISLPQGPKAVLFAQHQEAVRKDVERAFGVLQARFAIVKNSALFWDKVKIGKIMRSCIILHNMIVEDERDGYTQFNLSEFQQAEDNGSSHVDLKYSTDIPSNIANMMGVRTRIRDRQMHEQLKADLVEHLWSKFGRDEDNN